MAVLLSGAAKASLNFRFPSIFNGGRIDIYTGSQPGTANDAPTGIKIADVTAPNGLQFIVDNGEAIKHPAQVWTLKGRAAGVAGWFRLVGDPDDPDATGPLWPRLDGLCRGPNDNAAGLVLPALSITMDTERPVNGFVFTL